MSSDVTASGPTTSTTPSKAPAKGKHGYVRQEFSAKKEFKVCVMSYMLLSSSFFANSVIVIDWKGFIIDFHNYTLIVSVVFVQEYLKIVSESAKS